MILQHTYSSHSLLKMIRRYSPLISLSLRSRSITADANNFNDRKNTIDKNEINKFDEWANNWWDEMGEFKPLHSMNSLRIKLITGGLVNTGILQEQQLNSSKPLSGVKLLEVGCGGGILSEPLARLGADVTGLDASEQSICVAKLHASKDPKIANNLKYIYSTIEDYSANNINAYDVVVSSEVVEHISEKKLFIEKCAMTLKPGGSFFLTTLNRTTCSWLGAIILGENFFKVIPKGTHEWEKFISPTELENLLSSYNCYTILINGMAYNPFSNKWYWIKNTSISYALQAVKRKSSH